jgi:uncharacterized membrane protein YphA (DoxX/SURF4 family)
VWRALSPLVSARVSERGSRLGSRLLVDGRPDQRTRRLPLSTQRFRIGLVAVAALVALRLALGCHFLYEGVWKIKNAANFSAEPFLTGAKGPAAPLFNAMLSDPDGRQRLGVERDKDDRTSVNGQFYLAEWKTLKDEVAKKYGLDEEQLKKADHRYGQYEKSLTEYFKEQGPEMVAHFGSVDRFAAEQAKGNNGMAFQKKRIFDRNQEYRKAVKVWLTDLDGLTKDYHSALWNVLTEKQQAQGRLPIGLTRIDLVNFMVTYGLTAIGLCLMIGLFTEPAALGGAAFMLFVFLTQFPWPSIYPPAPPEAGHALLIDKNVVEMMALLAVAATSAGRWGGLDVFLHRWLGRLLRKTPDCPRKGATT